MFRTALWSAVAVLSLMVTGGCEQPSTVLRLKLGHSLDIQHPVHKAMLFMAERLRVHSGGTMAIDIYPNSELGNERELIELLQIGSLSMAKVSTSPLEGFVPEMKVFNIPYLFRDTDSRHAVLDSEIGKELLLAPERVRLRGLGYYDAGSRSFYTVARPIHTPDDLRGLKFRVQESQTAVQMIAAFGAAATPIAFGEIYTALQQGVVDGAENNPPSYYRSGHYEVAKFYTLDEHTAVPDILLIGTRVWNGLSAQQQAWLKLSVDESVEFERQLWQKATEDALEAVQASGAEIIHPDKSLFSKKVEGMYKLYEGSKVGRLIERIIAFQDKAFQNKDHP